MGISQENTSNENNKKSGFSNFVESSPSVFVQVELEEGDLHKEKDPS